jgi:hypothetical protein
MSQHRRRQAESNAGAFLGPDILVPVPMGSAGVRRDGPDEPEDDRVPEPPSPGVLRRFRERLMGRRPEQS